MATREDNGTVLVRKEQKQAVKPPPMYQVLLLNGRAVAAGSIKSAFTPDAIARAYGGRLNVLEQAVAEGGLR